MGNLDRSPQETVRRLADVSAAPVNEVYAERDVLMGESTVVRRLLPNLGRRLVGAWCFVDHYGPDDIEKEPGMAVPPHPSGAHGRQCAKSSGATCRRSLDKAPAAHLINRA
jgi:hypothetical protein